MTPGGCSVHIHHLTPSEIFLGLLFVFLILQQRNVKRINWYIEVATQATGAYWNLDNALICHQWMAMEETWIITWGLFQNQNTVRHQTRDACLFLYLLCTSELFYLGCLAKPAYKFCFFLSCDLTQLTRDWFGRHIISSSLYDRGLTADWQKWWRCVQSIRCFLFAATLAAWPYRCQSRSFGLPFGLEWNISTFMVSTGWILTLVIP